MIIKWTIVNNLQSFHEDGLNEITIHKYYLAWSLSCQELIQMNVLTPKQVEKWYNKKNGLIKDFVLKKIRKQTVMDILIEDEKHINMYLELTKHQRLHYDTYKELHEQPEHWFVEEAQKW